MPPNLGVALHKLIGLQKEIKSLQPINTTKYDVLPLYEFNLYLHI